MRLLTHGQRRNPKEPRAMRYASGSGTDDLRDIVRYLDASRPWWRRERARRIRRWVAVKLAQAFCIALISAGVSWLIVEYVGGGPH